MCVFAREREREGKRYRKDESTGVELKTCIDLP